MKSCIQTFLPIAISLFILVFPSYPCSSYFEEGDPFPTDLGFENPDLEDQFVDRQQDASKAFALTFSPFVFLPKVNVFKNSSYLFSQSPSLNQENLILRC